MDLDVVSDNFAFMMGGLGLTVQLAVITIVCGLMLGTLLALARLSSRVWLYWPATAYIHFFRGLPLILVIFWLYFLFPVITGKPMQAFAAAIVSFIVFEAAYFAEIIRAGIQSIPEGQSMAARASGLTGYQTVRYVILPQALRNMVPALVTQSVVIFQDTSLAYVIGLREFLRRVNLVDAREARSVELYLFAGAVYFAICSAGSLASQRLEKRRERMSLA
ncbi:glutamate and aspartate transporter subunit; membrane component of ABC superfamily [Desulfosarcina cetonica]|uniref:amino acid ABC transporter permease n=1 Tax=Desulfosarcina cetonica TaxID=90730 RepID=UPI0006D06964|nr:amino acid ABC transporter permease [Desulfosarcina cetonica]VTR67092.1 glutamate and aspartate transporter subunit; membrane component of ABC superfamily [Desulfosarcina cetonica]